LEGWGDPLTRKLSWITLFSSDITPTDGMTAGIAEILPGAARGRLHRHKEAEIYYIIEGSGVMLLNGEETPVGPGASVFIPGDALHGLRNTGDGLMKLFYVFPTGCFSDVVYHFAD
jgi:mannose-6-phosphate isomerase-like protein (cupin superfamily)